MFHPDQALFGRGPAYVQHAALHFRDDGYVDLRVTITPECSVDIVMSTMYAGLTLEEAVDVWMAQASLLGYGAPTDVP